jgi:hypothetical protein
MRESRAWAGPMPIRACPNCKMPASRTLESSSDPHVWVWYYRCLFCEHVWTIDKMDETKVTHVTPLKRPLDGRKGS